MKRALLIIAFFLVTAVPVTAQAATTFNITNVDMQNYLVDGTPDPVLTLTRGASYVFHVTTPGHPFCIQTIAGSNGDGTCKAAPAGVTNNGTANGDVTYTVPGNQTNPVFYQCGVHNAMGNTINFIAAPVPATGTLFALAISALLAAVGFAMIRWRRHQAA